MFITLEGIEGCGKTTQIKHMVHFLESRGAKCVTTRQPGGTPIGEKIRAILLNPDSKEMVPLTELLLYLADRAQHIHTFIKPHLAQGTMVLCDRYFDATVVYQGYARGLDIGLINQLHKILFANLQPDITFLLDLPPQVGLKRAWRQINDGARPEGECRFEEEAFAFHQKVRDGYLELAQIEPNRVRVIDATQNEHQVRNDIVAILETHLP